MSENLKLGQIIKDEQQRDAIHIAVAPMLAAENLAPGQHVAVIGAEAWGSSGEPVGVVDPYLKAAVRKGQKFWLFLYPGSITSLRHEWSHPALIGPADPRREQSEKWLRDFAEETYTDYTYMVNAAKKGEPITLGSSHLSINDSFKEKMVFWQHMEVVTGKRYSPDDIENSYFSCSC